MFCGFSCLSSRHRCCDGRDVYHVLGPGLLMRGACGNRIFVSMRTQLKVAESKEDVPSETGTLKSHRVYQLARPSRLQRLTSAR